MKSLILLLVLMAVMGIFTLSHADTTYVSTGSVSGVWTIDNSPYVVHNGDITVEDNDTLTIMAGVTVLFTARYKFIVEGLLTAEGTEVDSVIFTRFYPTEESKWRGFRFDEADEGSSLSWCRIEYAKGEGAYPEVRGGAIWINDCDVWIRHCSIVRNYTHNSNLNGSGAGIFMEGSNSIIEGCHFIQNQADNGGGICVGSESSPTIQFNLFEDNQTFSSGGGIYVAANSEALIAYNVFEGNHSGGIFGGGAINLWSATWLYGTTSEVYSNLIIGNSASSSGGGIYSRYDGSQIYNNTIVGNSAANGGGIYVLTFPDLPPTIYNSIVWENSAPTGSQIYLDPSVGSAANITYCDVQGGWAGSGNFDSNPLFVTGALGDYFLSQMASGQIHDSPCVDAGDPGSAMVLGTTRTDGVLDIGIVDLGFHLSPGGAPGWLTVGMNPNFVPTQIPANGGGFQFEICIANIGGEGMFFDVWINVIMPNGSVYGPVQQVDDLWLSTGDNLYRQNILQWVPGRAPAGMYSYVANVGEYPDYIIDSDSFPFEKLPGDGRAAGFEGWELSNWEGDAQASFYSTPPTEFVLYPAYPNPFNPETTIEFSLPHSADVSLSIYNSLGERVAVLLEGVVATGMHSVVWDASDFASGIYFYELKAGTFRGIGKCLLGK